MGRAIVVGEVSGMRGGGVGNNIVGLVVRTGPDAGGGGKRRKVVMMDGAGYCPPVMGASNARQ